MAYEPVGTQSHRQLIERGKLLITVSMAFITIRGNSVFNLCKRRSLSDFINWSAQSSHRDCVCIIFLITTEEKLKALHIFKSFFLVMFLNLTSKVGDITEFWQFLRRWKYFNWIWIANNFIKLSLPRFLFVLMFRLL